MNVILGFWLIFIHNILVVRYLWLKLQGEIIVNSVRNRGPRGMTQGKKGNTKEPIQMSVHAVEGSGVPVALQHDERVFKSFHVVNSTGGGR